MSKKLKTKIENDVMSKITSGKIAMKPKWLFIIGSLLTFLGLIFSIITSIFLVNLIFFISRKHGSNAINRFNEILNSLPIWIPIVAILGVAIGIMLLKKYDFSYKKNFYLIITAFIVSIIFAGFLIDKLNLNNIWSKRNSMKRFYKSVDTIQMGRKWEYNKN